MPKRQSSIAHQPSPCLAGSQYKLAHTSFLSNPYKLHVSPRLSSAGECRVSASFGPFSRKKSVGPKLDDMTGSDGDVSPPAPLHAGTPISGSSAAPISASGGDLGRSMKRGKELALEGGSSACAELDALGVHRCSRCRKQFKNEHALNGHKRIHKKRGPPPPKKQRHRPKNQQPPLKQVHEEQDEELTLILPKLVQGTLNKMDRETKGDGSAEAEGGASSSAAGAHRKNIHMELDLNKAPEDDENDGEEGS